MSASNESNGRAELAPGEASVLANLPRHRPQRATARRTAARGKGSTVAAEKKASTGATGTKRARAKAEPAARKRPAKTATKPRPNRRQAVEQEQVPRQGYESVEERATGPVQPPGGAELIGTAVEIIGELTKAGLSGGERLLRDVLGRLPG